MTDPKPWWERDDYDRHARHVVGVGALVDAVRALRPERDQLRARANQADIELAEADRREQGLIDKVALAEKRIAELEAEVARLRAERERVAVGARCASIHTRYRDRCMLPHEHVTPHQSFRTGGTPYTWADDEGERAIDNQVRDLGCLDVESSDLD